MTVDDSYIYFIHANLISDLQKHRSGKRGERLYLKRKNEILSSHCKNEHLLNIPSHLSSFLLVNDILWFKAIDPLHFPTTSVFSITKSFD
jgi:hypothetical protein